VSSASYASRNSSSVAGGRPCRAWSVSFRRRASAMSRAAAAPRSSPPAPAAGPGVTSFPWWPYPPAPHFNQTSTAFNRTLSSVDRRNTLKTPWASALVSSNRFRWASRYTASQSSGYRAGHF
jgi:hypothetical protein